MSEEAAFLRAIQANPTDATAKLVYADWLDDQGEPERAKLLREVVTNGWPAEKHSLYPGGMIQTMFALGTLGDAWRHLVQGQVPLWNPPTLLALGRLQGFLLANSYANNSTLGYSDPVRRVYFNHTGEASLLPLGSVNDLANDRFAEYLPVHLELLQDWEGALRAVLTRWLFRDPAGPVFAVRAGDDVRQVRTEQGHRFVVENAVRLVLATLRPERGWRISVTTTEYYAMDSDDFALEAADRVLFLHFSFSD